MIYKRKKFLEKKYAHKEKANLKKKVYRKKFVLRNEYSLKRYAVIRDLDHFVIVAESRRATKVLNY